MWDSDSDSDTDTKSDTEPNTDGHGDTDKDGDAATYRDPAGDTDRDAHGDGYVNTASDGNPVADDDAEYRSPVGAYATDSGAYGNANVYTDVDAGAARRDADDSAYASGFTTDWWRRVGRRRFRLSLVGSGSGCLLLDTYQLGHTAPPANLNLIWKEGSPWFWDSFPNPEAALPVFT